jgi:tetratricopeptide (TPR) repeat protein
VPSDDGHGHGADAGSALERASQLHAAGIAANSDMHPVLGARRLRAALRVLGDPARDDEPRRALRGRTLISLALAESEQGRTEAGLRLLDEAEPLLPREQLGVLHGQRGMLLRRTGHDDLALREYTAALQLLDERTDPEAVARVVLNRSAMLMATVRLRQARADLDRCMRIAAEHGFDWLAAKAGHNLGYLDYLAGDIPSALRRYADTARKYAQLTPGMLPVLSLDRARVLLAAGLFTEADRELAQALGQLGKQRAGQDHAEAQLARAEAAMLARRPAAARRFAERAYELFERRGNPRWAARARLVAVRADYAAGGVRSQAVAERAAELRSTLKSLSIPDDARVAGLFAARALAASGEIERAEREVRACAARPADRLDTRLLWRLAAAETATASGRPADAARHLTAGLSALRQARAQFGTLDLQTGAAVHGRELAEAGLRAAIAAGDVSEIFRWAELARAQALLLPSVRPSQDPETAAALEELRGVQSALVRAQLAGAAPQVRSLRSRRDELQRTLREHAWFAAGPGTAARPVTLARVRAELGDAALVVYLRAGRALHALVVAGGRTELVRLDRFTAAEEALLRLRADLDAQAGRALPERLARAVHAATRHNAAVLDAAILAPLLPRVGDRELVVVPTGSLITVPWAMLPGAATRPVTVAPSASSWRAARARMLSRTDGDTRVLAVAGPRNDRGVSEVHEVAAMSHTTASTTTTTKTPVTTTILTGPDATAAATLAALPDADLAHFAAHGHHQSDNALFSGLELSGGPLMGYDVHLLPRTPRMVVLSSCDLGLHDVRPGDESLGMASVLLSAGTSTVVASVCRIADTTASTMMTTYHKALRSGRPPAAALAEASDPALPSGFVCFGAG